MQGTYIRPPPSTDPLAFEKFNQTLIYVPNIESILIWKLCLENDGTINLVKWLSIVFFQTILEKICVDFSKYTPKFENIWWKCEHFSIKATIYLKSPPPPPHTNNVGSGKMDLQHMSPKYQHCIRGEGDKVWKFKKSTNFFPGL
jgi:DNA modification methylase